MYDISLAWIVVILVAIVVLPLIGLLWTIRRAGANPDDGPTPTE